MIFIWKLFEKIQPYFVITYHDTRNMRATSLKITPYFASQKKEEKKNHQTPTPSCAKSYNLSLILPL